jgi:DnaK suppressor protein
MTIDTNDRLHALRQLLQTQAERHTDELTRLTTQGSNAEHNGLDPETVAAFTESARQALADTIDALRRMAEGSYGSCQQCQGDIPVERLEILPHAPFCVPCQEARRS